MEKVKGLLGGLSLGEIPIAGSKRRSIAISLQGQLYRIGRIPANRAFVVIRGNLRLLYVCPEYGNYRYAAKKVFRGVRPFQDADHALGRKLTQHHRFWYTLATRLDRRVNRSHGRREVPPVPGPYQIVLDKFCYTDERILRKILGLPAALLPVPAQTNGYSLVRAHERVLTYAEAMRARSALGMDDLNVDHEFLQPIDR
jgi:hypothetical protein